METKKGVNCFRMKNDIIKQSIEGLQRDGLRFSIDDVAKSLKISKKTIYKYFATKEDLAVEVFNTYYEDAMHRLMKIADIKLKDVMIEKLTIYFQSHCMIRKEVFNKYALNTNIRSLAQINHNRIKMHIENMLPEQDKTVLMVIIDGTMQKLCENNSEIKKVIERLATLIC